MTDYIVNYDISYQLTNFLPISSIICFAKLNWSTYNLVASLPIFKELKNCKEALNQIKVEMDQLGQSYACERLSTAVLQAIYASGSLKIIKNLIAHGKKYTFDKAWNIAAANGKVLILEWARTSKLGLTCLDDLVYDAICENRVAVLDWMKESNLHFTYTSQLVDCAAVLGHLDVLNWFVKHGYTLNHTADATECASADGDVDILNLLLKHSDTLAYTSSAMNEASSKGHLIVLHWWLRSGLKLKYSECAIERAIQNNHLTVIDWWLHSGLKLKCSDSFLTAFLKKDKVPKQIYDLIAQRKHQIKQANLLSFD